MNSLPVDIDAETVQLDGQWLTRDALAQRIRAMLDSGDFQVARPSQALEHLNHTLSSVRTLGFRATPELVDALNAATARTGKGMGTLIREALQTSFGHAVHAAPSQSPTVTVAPVPLTQPAEKTPSPLLRPVVTPPDKNATVTMEPAPSAPVPSAPAPAAAESSDDLGERGWFSS